MRSAEIQIGSHYTARIDQLDTVVEALAHEGNSWRVRNLRTGRKEFLPSSRRFVRAATRKEVGEAKAAREGAMRAREDSHYESLMVEGDYGAALDLLDRGRHSAFDARDLRTLQSLLDLALKARGRARGSASETQAKELVAAIRRNIHYVSTDQDVVREVRRKAANARRRRAAHAAAWQAEPARPPKKSNALKNAALMASVVAIIVIAIFLAAGGRSHTASSGAAGGSPTDANAANAPQTQMDQVKAIVSERTEHDVANITCSHNVDYFCTATDWAGRDFDYPNTARCWRVTYIGGQPEFDGPANYYCP